jgi:hypothetical protein
MVAAGESNTITNSSVEFTAGEVTTRSSAVDRDDHILSCDLSFALELLAEQDSVIVVGLNIQDQPRREELLQRVKKANRVGYPAR